MALKHRLTSGLSPIRAGSAVNRTDNVINDN